MGAMASQINSLAMVYSCKQAQFKENIKAPRHWPLCGEFTGGRWIPAQMASNADYVSISWRHHDEFGPGLGSLVQGSFSLTIIPS